MTDNVVFGDRGKNAWDETMKNGMQPHGRRSEMARM